MAAKFGKSNRRTAKTGKNRQKQSKKQEYFVKSLVNHKKIHHNKGVIKTRKLLSIVLATILMLTFSVSALAQETATTVGSDSYVEVSIDDLNRDISIAFYNDDFGKTIVKTITA